MAAARRVALGELDAGGVTPRARTGGRLSAQFGRSAELSAREFNRRVADPELFSGGGSVAALSAAGAGAVTHLVARLSARRRANVAAADELASSIDAIEQLVERFYAAADHDLIVLDQLLAAQRALKGGAPRRDYIAALFDAARSPIELAEDGLRLLDEIERQLPYASRFTVSDLGAAAALVAGACAAALLTAEVNLALLRDEADADAALLDDARRRADRAGNESVARAAALTERARRAIDRPGNRHA